jgi:hypothetical protein
VLNAVADALGLVDGDELQLPATPEKVWALAQKTRSDISMAEAASR